MTFELDSSLENTADTLVAEMPEPQAHAITEAIKEGVSESETAIEIDALGVPWNSNDHAMSADGSHPKTAKGIWKKRRGKKGADSILREPNSFTNSAASADSTDGVSAPSSSEIAARQSGATVAAMMINLCVGIGGNDWKPRTPPESIVDEQEFLVKSWGDYAVSKQWTDLPPGVALVFACVVVYALPRLRMEETQTRVQKVWGWCKEKIYRMRNRKKKGDGKVIRIVQPAPEDGDASATP